MTDPYVWIDPFEEVARANSRAAYAREQGRNDILEIEAQQPGLLRAAIEDQAYKLAERVVQDQIRPTLHEAMTQCRIRDASLDLLSFTPLRHVVAAAESRTISPVYDIQDQAIRLRTEVRVVRPFEYAMQTML